MTETSTLTLADFLLARIAEDEAVARHAQAVSDGHLWVVTGMDDAVVEYDPARVLAECEAKRRIVEWAGRALELGDSWPILCLLGLPYAEHPDYREVWRPDARLF